MQALDPYPSGNPAYDAFIGGIRAATQGIVNVSRNNHESKSKILILICLAAPHTSSCAKGVTWLWKAIFKNT